MTPAVFVASEELPGNDGGLDALVKVCRRAGASVVITCRGPVPARYGTLRQAQGRGISILTAEDLPGVPDGLHREDPSCGCGTCRVRTLMLSTTGEEHLIVYVGGAAEDIVPARAADIVFARGALQACCQRENISFTPHHSPAAAAAGLDVLFARTRLRTRWMAEQHRRSLFMAEA